MISENNQFLMPFNDLLLDLNPNRATAPDVHKDTADVVGSKLEHKSPKNPTNQSRPFWPWRSNASMTVWISLLHPMFDE